MNALILDFVMPLSAGDPERAIALPSIAGLCSAPFGNNNDVRRILDRTLREAGNDLLFAAACGADPRRPATRPVE
jgi:hypothetical protein